MGEKFNWAGKTDKWVKDVEVSAITGIAVQTLRNQRFDGCGIPYSKVGRMCLYNVRDVIQYMKSRRVMVSA